MSWKDLTANVHAGEGGRIHLSAHPTPILPLLPDGKIRWVQDSSPLSPLLFLLFPLPLSLPLT